MKKAAAQPTTSNAHDDANFGFGVIALDFLDTTWRITVPAVLFAGIGIVIDIKAHTKPWFTLVGLAAGLVIAGLLVKKQLAAAQRRDDNTPQNKDTKA